MPTLIGLLVHVAWFYLTIGSVDITHLEDRLS